MIEHFPRDFSIACDDILELFGVFFRDKSHAAYEQVKLHMLQAMNCFVLRHCRDYFFSTRDLVDSLQKPMYDIWHSSHNYELRIAIVHFLQIAMRLKLLVHESPLDDNSHVMALVKYGLNNERLFTFRVKK